KANPLLVQATSRVPVQPARTVDPAPVSPVKAKVPPANIEDGGTLSIASTKPAAEVFVDSIGRGKAPATFEVKPGKHSVQVVLDGYQDWVQEVSVNAGQVINVTANLEAVGAGQSEKQIVNVAPAHMPATLSPTPIFPDSSTVRKSQGKNEGAKPEPATGAVASGGRGDIGITAV